MKRIMLILITLFIQTAVAEDTKQQKFTCGSRTISVNCEKQNGNWFVKSNEFENALTECNNVYGSQLKLGTVTNCKLSREKDEEFADTKCDKKQAFHCIQKSGQVIKIDAPCQTVSGKCVVKEQAYDNAKSLCDSVYNGELKLSAVQVCKLPDEE